MGYYSEVALAFTKKGHEQFTALLSGQMLSGQLDSKDSPFDMLEAADKTYYENESILYHWKNIKWSYYSSAFPEIKAIMDVFFSLAYDKYRFIRIGEDPSDIETAGGMIGPPFLGIVSKISISE